MSQTQAGERDFFRVKAELMIRLGPDTMTGRQAMALDSELWQSQTKLAQRATSILENMAVSDDIKPILEVMRWLDYKLDLVLHQLRSRELDQHFPIQTTTTDISGSGLGLKSAGDLALNDRVLVSLILPDSPARPIFAGGRIVRCDVEQHQNQAECAVYLEDISDLNRERLIRFNFQQQRKDLAARTTQEVI